MHPQSIIHGMVEFSDRSVVAQLGAPDMRIPIAHCLGWPDRIVGPVGQARSRQDRTADLRGAGFRAVPGACGWPTRRCVPAAARPRYTMPPTRWRWRRSSPAQIKFGAIARLVEATMNDWIRAGNLRAFDARPTTRLPLTIMREIELPPYCLKLP